MGWTTNIILNNLNALLLCFGCFTGLGLFQGSPSFLPSRIVSKDITYTADATLLPSQYHQAVKERQISSIIQNNIVSGIQGNHTLYRKNNPFFGRWLPMLPSLNFCANFDSNWFTYVQTVSIKLQTRPKVVSTACDRCGSRHSHSSGDLDSPVNTVTKHGLCYLLQYCDDSPPQPLIATLQVKDFVH